MTKDQIDRMGYEEMLRLWRFEPVGSPVFSGEIGKYFAKRMQEQKQLLSHEDQVQASKNVGWDIEI